MPRHPRRDRAWVSGEPPGLTGLPRPKEGQLGAFGPPSVEAPVDVAIALSGPETLLELDGKYRLMWSVLLEITREGSSGAATGQTALAATPSDPSAIDSSVSLPTTTSVDPSLGISLGRKSTFA